MSEKLYEGMFLLDSGRFATNPQGTSQEVIGLLEKADANIVAHRPWADGKLAYEIDGHRKGLHYLVYFKMDGSKMPEVTRACKLNDAIIRQLIIHHPQSLFDAMVTALESSEGITVTEDTRRHAPANDDESDDDDDDSEDSDE